MMLILELNKELEITKREADITLYRLKQTFSLKSVKLSLGFGLICGVEVILNSDLCLSSSFYILIIFIIMVSSL